MEGVLRSGRLDRRITLQRKTVTENSYGEPVESWKDLATVWAEYMPARGAERYASMQTIGEIEIRWRIRYRSGLTPIDRIVYQGRVHNVTSIIEIGRGEGLEIYTRGRAE